MSDPNIDNTGLIRLERFLGKTSSKPAISSVVPELNNLVKITEFQHNFFAKKIMPAIISKRGTDIDKYLEAMDPTFGLRQAHTKHDQQSQLSPYADYYAGITKDPDFIENILSSCGALISSFMLLAQDLNVSRIESLSKRDFKTVVKPTGDVLGDAIAFAAMIIGALALDRFTPMHEAFIKEYIQCGFCPAYEPIVVTLTAVLIVHHYMLYDLIDRKSFRKKVGKDIASMDARQVFALLPKVFRFNDK